MACYHPLQGYRCRQRGQNGKFGITFDLREGYRDMPVSVPCGQCLGCRLEKKRQWAVRCMHEASLHKHNSYLTLTYDDEHLPKGGNLDRGAFPAFMKRLRKKYGKGPRYFHAGEYGEDFCRPHYHAILFNHHWTDGQFVCNRKGKPVYTSAELTRLWRNGFAEYGDVTYQSAAYVAGYTVKKVTGPMAEPYYDGLVPEYATMSRRPGIGKGWYDKYAAEVYPSDEIIINGRPQKPPTYYDKIHESLQPEHHEEIVKKRKEMMDRKDLTERRLMDREACAQARVNLKRRVAL